MRGLSEDQRVLVTGVTGSLGRVLCRRPLSSADGVLETVTVFSGNEAKQHCMRLDFVPRAPGRTILERSRRRLRFMIGDVRDYASLLRAAKHADIESAELEPDAMHRHAHERFAPDVVAAQVLDVYRDALNG